MRYILSIVIPVYNVEKFIEECFDSIFFQLPKTVEIVIVNDGTPDKSIDILKIKYYEWLRKDQVVLVEQDNAGPGEARNRGVSRARGKYLGFLDSDDVLLCGFFNLILEKLDAYNDIDIIEFGFQRFHHLSEINKERYFPLYTFKGKYKLSEVRNKIFSIGIWFPCIRVYRKELFEKIRFPARTFYEDLMTIPYIYLEDLKIYFINQPLIGYRYNPNSTTSLHEKSHAIDMYSFYISLAKMKNTVPVAILKIKTARSIIFFCNELDSLDFILKDILTQIKKIKKRQEILRCLNLPDLFFFVFPNIYRWIDKIRLSKLRSKKI